jgi:hypothetical protein
MNGNIYEMNEDKIMLIHFNQLFYFIKQCFYYNNSYKNRRIWGIL